jgi:hypothetical protein
MSKLHNIGVFAWGIDSLMQTPPEGFRFVYLVARETVEEEWIRRFLNPKEILLYSIHDPKSHPLFTLGTEGVLRHSDATEVLKQANIQTLWITSKCTDFIHRWSQDNRIKILSTEFGLQKKIENKIWFDAFLAEHKLPKPKSEVRHLPTEPITLRGPVVVQQAESNGGTGTFFLKSGADIASIMPKGKTVSKVPFLVRERVEGKTYGITVFVTQSLVSLSALRLQCFTEKYTENQGAFLGVQWVPSKTLDPAMVSEVNTVFLNTGSAFRDLGFSGFANIDFIYDSKAKKVSILECNPRLSGATAQLFKFRLSEPLDIGRLFIQGFFDPQPKAEHFEFHPLPKTEFQGSSVQIDVAPGQPGATLQIKHEHQSGLYQYLGGKSTWTSTDARTIGTKKPQFVFISMAKKGDLLTHSDTLGDLQSNFPLFDLSGRLNHDGKNLLSQFKF